LGEVGTHHHSDDWNEKGYLRQAVEDEEDASNHLGGCFLALVVW
jgi:hypothetical protein